MTLLEQTLPTGHFECRHSRWIHAAPPRVWEALTTVRLEDLGVGRVLVALRHPRRRLPGGALFDKGLLTILEIDGPRYALAGAIARPWQPRPQRRELSSLRDFAEFSQPGWIKYLTDFSVVPKGNGTRITTVTRGVCTSAAARRWFAAYWSVIRVPSGLVRGDLLAATERSARS